MDMYNESLRAFLRPILPYLDDESVSEIMINGPEDIWIERTGRLIKTDARFSEEGLMGAARNMAQYVGRVMSDERPRLDAPVCWIATRPDVDSVSQDAQFAGWFG